MDGHPLGERKRPEGQNPAYKPAHRHHPASTARGLRRIRAPPEPNTRAVSLEPTIFEHVFQGSKIYTDSYSGYRGIHEAFEHETVNHEAGKYVRGEAHSNTIESFWLVFKRALHGTYVAVELSTCSATWTSGLFSYTRHRDDQGRFPAFS